MMTKKIQEPKLPNLCVSRSEAEKKLKERIDRGREIQNRKFNSDKDLETAEAEQSRWSSYTSELLARLFDNRSIVEEYEAFYGTVIPFNPSFDRRVNDFRKDIGDSINRLESIKERLPLMPEPKRKPLPSAKPKRKSTFSKNIFIVHGHDESAKEAVARFVEKIGLKPIVLHEQPNAGRTIIEKFEDHSNVGFAIVLLTPDDVGASKDKTTEAKSRARQNVILELGYFMGKLGRGRVCALYKEGVEIPSDYQGVLYIPMDFAGAWRMALAKEIKNAGIDVDLNKVI
jgi:predicted nucleotide-binding protein